MFINNTQPLTSHHAENLPPSQVGSSHNRRRARRINPKTRLPLPDYELGSGPMGQERESEAAQEITIREGSAPGRLLVFIPTPIFSAIVKHNSEIYPSQTNHESTEKLETSSRTSRVAIAIVPLSGDLATHVRRINSLFDPREKRMVRHNGAHEITRSGAVGETFGNANCGAHSAEQVDKERARVRGGKLAGMRATASIPRVPGVPRAPLSRAE